MFNEALSIEYSDFSYFKAHHYYVDLNEAQHPGEKSNQKADYVK